MSEQKNPSDKASERKKSLIQWVGLIVIAGTLYLTGLHTPIIATMQQGLMLTGFFDARASDVESFDGPFLSNSDYNFQMTTADGQELRLRDLEDDVTFVNVWASWCPPCIAEMPTIETLYSEIGDHDNISFVMLSVDEEREKAVEFMEGNGYTMPYQFPASARPEVFQSSQIPTTYVISREGQIVYEKAGFADYSAPEFRDWLLKLSEGDEEPA